MGKQVRLGLLVAILLASATYLLSTYGLSLGLLSGWWTSDSVPKVEVLPGTNEVVSVNLTKVNASFAMVEVEYLYTGSAGPMAQLTVTAETGSTGTVASSESTLVSAGRGKVALMIRRPTDRSEDPTSLTKAVRSNTVLARLTSLAESPSLFEGRFTTPIVWPSSDPFDLSGDSPEEFSRLYQLCVDTIDQGHQMDLAKRGLEQILLAKPEFVPAYAELARHQMKTNWSPAGLAQAEQSLKTALRMDPDHANSHVLIGYVYTHQRRFKEAEDAYRKAEAIGTRNIWLYSNWGELRDLEGKRRGAIEMYRRAIDAPEDLKTYERARTHAYERLLDLLVADKQWDAVDTLHQQRTSRYPNNGCYKASQAEFLLMHHGRYDESIAIATDALDRPCLDGRIYTPGVLAMGYYSKWAAALGQTSKVRDADQYFSRGQALHSDMTLLQYWMAESPHTASVIPALKQRGVNIDVPDKDGMTALAYGIVNRNHVATRRLLRYGANVNQRLNRDGLTPLMLAASQGDRDMVVLLLKSGADKRLQTRSGYNSERIALERGHKDIASMIAGRSGI